MALNDKLDATKDKVSGDEKLEAKGKTEGLMGKAKEGLENIKDKASDLAEDVAEKFNDTVDSVKHKKDN